MFKALNYLNKNLVYAVPLTMLIALLFGYFFDAQFLNQFVIGLTFLIVYPIMVNLNFNELVSRGNLKLHVITQLINFIVIPLIGFVIGNMFFSDSIYFLTGMLLISLLPAAGMTISWTGFADGNISAAIKMMITGIVLGSLLAPLYLNFLIGKSIDITFINIFSSIITVVIIPMIVGYLTQKFLVHICGNNLCEKIKNNFLLFSNTGLIGVVFITTAVKAKTILANPNIILNIIVALLLFYIINFAISHFISRKLFGRQNAIAMVYGIAMRSLAIALAIALTALGPNGSDAALIITVAVIVQIQGAVWYLRVLERLG